MNAIILSRDDARAIDRFLYSLGYPNVAPTKFFQDLHVGSEGYNWLNAVPDEVLRILESAMDIEYSLDFESVKGLDVRYNIKSEIDRRERAKA